MTAWGLVFAAAAVMLTIVLFVTGMVHPRPTVLRVQNAHDAEMQRLMASSKEQVDGLREEATYWRNAALSCSSAVAHREAQVSALLAQLEMYRRQS